MFWSYLSLHIRKAKYERRIVTGKMLSTSKHNYVVWYFELGLFIMLIMFIMLDDNNNPNP